MNTRDAVKQAKKGIDMVPLFPESQVKRLSKLQKFNKSAATTVNIPAYPAAKKDNSHKVPPPPRPANSEGGTTNFTMDEVRNQNSRKRVMFDSTPLKTQFSITKKP